MCTYLDKVGADSLVKIKFFFISNSREILLPMSSDIYVHTDCIVIVF